MKLSLFSCIFIDLLNNKKKKPDDVTTVKVIDERWDQCVSRARLGANLWSHRPKVGIIIEIKVALNVIMKRAVLSGATCLFAFNMPASIERINTTIWGINECFKRGNKFIKTGITA